MAARRLRGVRREPHKPTFPDDEAVRFADEHPKLVVAPGHFDGDGCVFPTRGHLIAEPAPRER